jgi:hypothetical protein
MKKALLTGVAAPLLASCQAPLRTAYIEGCHVNGYVTCSISGNCLNHCGKWVGPQKRD